MTLVGGIRDRMVKESVGNAIQNHLTSQGWFASGRKHKPVRIVDEFPLETDEIKPNVLAFSVDDHVGPPLEMGSKAEEHETTFFVDIFAESDAIGTHVIGDVYAFLKENPVIQVYDYRMATPTPSFQVFVDERTVDWRKPARAVTPWQRHWYTCSFTVSDIRSNG